MLQRWLSYFVLTLGQKVKGDYHRRNQCSVRKMRLNYIAKKYKVSFWLSICGGSTHRKRKLRQIWNFEENLSNKQWAFMFKCLFKNLILSELTLTWPPSEVRLNNVIGSLPTSTSTTDIYVQNDPGNMCRSACSWSLFCGELYGLALTLIIFDILNAHMTITLPNMYSNFTNIMPNILA